MKDQEEKQDDQDIRTLNKASIAEALIAQIPELDRPHAKLIVETFFELIAEHLEKGDTVKIPGLGNFSVRDKVARPGRNLTITERRVVTFHPSGTLNARVTTNLIPPQEQPRTRRTRAVLKDKE